MKLPLGIYVHIPFCVRKCAYCDFLSFPADENVRAAYVAALLEEIRRSDVSPDRFEAATVFFGGGTPSILDGGDINCIMNEIRARFSVRGDAEITVECNPGTLDKDKLRAYADCGVNRLSIGLQSADDCELRLLGRIHTWNDFLYSYSLARGAGFGNINIDLISALPYQSRNGWLESLRRAAALEPEHISAYSLIVEEGTPFYAEYGPDGLKASALPDEDTERMMYEDTKSFLSSRGYERYEISNYARQDFECRHNLSYWDRTDYIGFGLGAASLIDNVRFHNGTDIDEYIKCRFEKQDVQRLTLSEQLEETMFLGLRKTRGVRLTDELTRTYEDVFSDLEQKGLLVREDGYARLTDRGIDVSNYAMAEFLR